MSTKRKRHVPDDDGDEEFVPGRQILPVANLPADFDGVPTDGLEYLFTVRRDAKKLPMVTRVANPLGTPGLPIPQRDYNKLPSHPQLPSDSWRESHTTRFQNFRKNLGQPAIHVSIPNGQVDMPDKKERDLWWAFLAGKPESEWNPPKQIKSSVKRGMRAFTDDPGVVTQETWSVNDDGEVELASRVEPTHALPTPTGSIHELEEAGGAQASTDASVIQECKPRPPTPALLREMDERMALHLLMYLTHWMNRHLNDADLPRMSEVHAQWMFSLLARVGDHIGADDMSLLRAVARACIALLKALIRERSEDRVTEDGSMNETSCWIIISTVAGVWAQKDLWMDVEDMLKSCTPVVGPI